MHVMDDASALFASDFGEVHRSAEPTAATRRLIFNFNQSFYVFQSPQGLTKAAVITAVKAGYRFIDCANDYDNEHTIGEALKELYAEGVVKRFIIYVLLFIILLTRSSNQFRNY